MYKIKLTEGTDYAEIEEVLNRARIPFEWIADYTIVVPCNLDEYYDNLDALGVVEEALTEIEDEEVIIEEYEVI